MEFQQLLYLVTIAEEGNISKAADQLMVSQPAITRSIQRLEDELNLKLFDRTKNKIILNEDGKFVLEYAKNIMNDVNTMETSIHNYIESKNKIRIGSIAPAPLWGLEYLYHHQIESILDEDVEMLMNQFDHYQCNLLVLDYPIRKPKIKCIPYIRERLYIGIKKNHPLANYKSITFQELNGQTFLVSKAIGYWNDIIHEKLNQSILIYEDYEIYLLLSQVTDFLVFRSNLTIHSVQEDLIYIPIVDEEASLTFYIHYHENQHQFDNLRKDIHNINWSEVR